MSCRCCLILVAMMCLVLLPLTAGQVKLTGDIDGLVLDANGEALPGASITLTGPKLFQSSLSAQANEKGAFRFLGLNPGEYSLEIKMSGFDTLIVKATVSVGVATPVRARLAAAKPNQEVVVKAEAPLVELKSAQTSVNYSSLVVSQVPTTRNVQDLMEAAPAINDNGAYGAGARVRDDYYKGSGANAYLLNGVDISDLASGATWVNPNYDSVEEIQIVGIGASAEYGNFSGGVLNVVTKTGSNAFHGGLSTYFTNHSLWGDNSGGIEDLAPKQVRFNTETSFSLGGPLIKEKLFFFAAGGFTGVKSRRPSEPAYGNLKQPRFQGTLSWLPSPKHAFTLMANVDPLNHDNLGLVSGSGPEIAYSRKFRSSVLTASWRFTPNASSLYEVKYAGFHGRDLTDPATSDVAAVNDYSVYRFYGSSGIIQDNVRDRNQVNASTTQYLDHFLGASHELKVGLEYEASAANNDIDTTGPGDSMFEIYQLDTDLYMYLGYENYEQHTKARVNRIGAFIQDNVQIGTRLSLNLGARLDAPRLTAVGHTGTIANFTNIAPRLGLTYDLTGDAKNVFHASYGRYYDKMTSDGFSSALPGMGAVNLYMTFATTPFDPTAENLANIAAFVNQPANLYYVLPAGESIAVNSNLKGPYTDVLSLEFERQIFRNVAASVEYVHKNDRGFIGLATSTPHTYQEVPWTDPYLGKTISVWEQTDAAPDVWSYANSTWAKRRHNFVIATLRTLQTAKWSLMASAVYQDSQGNIDNISSSIGAGGYGIDTDPNYTENPLVWGKLRYDRTWQFKVLGSYALPWGLRIAGDAHVLSGVAWSPTISSSFTGLYFPQADTLLLEQRGSERAPWTWYLNLRLSKRFMIGGAASMELMADVFNLFNKANTAYVATEPYAIFPISGDPAYGQAFALSDPIYMRLGLRLGF